MAGALRARGRATSSAAGVSWARTKAAIAAALIAPVLAFSPAVALASEAHDTWDGATDASWYAGDDGYPVLRTQDECAFVAKVLEGSGTYGTAFESLPVTMTNNGTTELQIASVTLGGANADAFEVVAGNAAVAPGASDSSWKLVPKERLDAGAYTADVTVTDANGGTTTAQASFTVSPAELKPVIMVVYSKEYDGNAHVTRGADGSCEGLAPWHQDSIYNIIKMSGPLDSADVVLNAEGVAQPIKGTFTAKLTEEGAKNYYIGEPGNTETTLTASGIIYSQHLDVAVELESTTVAAGELPKVKSVTFSHNGEVVELPEGSYTTSVSLDEKVGEATVTVTLAGTATNYTLGEAGETEPRVAELTLTQKVAVTPSDPDDQGGEQKPSGDQGNNSAKKPSIPQTGDAGSAAALLVAATGLASLAGARAYRRC